MATRYSVQTQRSDPASQNYELRTSPSEVNTSLKIDYFYRGTTDATNGNLGDGDVVRVARLPKGARILGGVLKTTALGASVVAKVGLLGTKTGTAVDDDDALLAAATDVSAISSNPLAATLALGYGSVLTEESWVVVTLSGAAPAADKEIFGHIEYVQN